MQYIKMFDNEFLEGCSKPSRRRYGAIKEFIRTVERAKKLDELKVPNWYVEIFADFRWWEISFIPKEISWNEKIELFEKLLKEKQKIKYRKEKVLLWKLTSGYYYEVTGYISIWTRDSLNQEERAEQERIRKIKRAEYEEKQRRFRREHGNIFGNVFNNLLGIDRNYRILGVNTNATKLEIKKTYRDLCKKHHPDKGGDVNKFREINEAYNFIVG